VLGKRKISTKFQPNKLTKLSDIASNALVIAETSIEFSEKISEEIQEQEESPSVITPVSKKSKGRLLRTKKV